MKVLKGCLVTLAVLLLLLFAGGAYLYINRDEIGSRLSKSFGSESFPEYARPETALADNADVIAALDAAAVESKTFFQFAAAVEALDLPPKVIYVGAEVGDDDNNSTNDKETEIIKRRDWSGHSSRSVNNVGLAKLRTGDGETTAVIIRRTGPWDYMQNFRIYVEHTPTPAEPPTE